MPNARVYDLGTQVKLFDKGIAASLVAAVWLYFKRIFKLPLLNQVLSLTICSILLPPVSHDYTLIQMYAPWAIVHADYRYAGQFKALVLLVLLLLALRFPLENESWDNESLSDNGMFSYEGNDAK